LEKANNIEPIGEGHFGSVYKGAIQKEGKEIFVAIKCLRENCGFAVYEFMMLSLCKHKNILAPFKLIGRRVLVTECMKKGTIKKYLNEHGRLIGDREKELRFWNWACDVADGMNYLHAQQILHLDLHTGNILIRDDFTAVIGDFGQSRGKKSNIDSPQFYSSQLLKYSFVKYLTQTEPFSDRTDVLFFGWVLSNFLQENYKPSWDSPNVTAPLQLQLIKQCLNQAPANRPPFSKILKTSQKNLQKLGKHTK